MQVDLSTNFFDLFALERSFNVDQADLSKRFQELQKQLHPDKFAARPAAERRWSVQAASFVNEGYQTLGRDLSRAVYLLKLQGVSIDEETDTHVAPQFLMEQMEYREALEDASSASDPFAALDSIRRKLKMDTADQVAAFGKALTENDWTAARTVVRQWQFLDKLNREVKFMEESLDM